MRSAYLKARSRECVVARRARNGTRCDGRRGGEQVGGSCACNYASQETDKVHAGQEKQAGALGRQVILLMRAIAAIVVVAVHGPLRASSSYVCTR